MTLEQPEKIGRYEVRAELGRDAIGIVYEAFDPDLERVVAVKTLSVPAGLAPHDRESLEAHFYAEARLAARLSHPGIVKIHETGRTLDTGLLYMVLELPDGSTLAELLPEGPLAWRTALHVAAALADAVDYAHGQGVIHRDIKPENIMVLPGGEAKIMDFGMAKVETARLKLTMSGQFFGTPLYMSPEQALGAPLDNRIDLFALGAVLYQTLTGRPAFGADTLGKIVAKVILDDPPPPSTLVSGLPSDADYVVARALAKDPEHRYYEGREMVADLMDVLAGRPPGLRGSWVPPDPGPPAQVTEQQVASLRRGAFLPPAVEHLDPEDESWAMNIHRSVGGTLISTPRHRALPSSPRRGAPEPSADTEPAVAPALTPAPLSDVPTLVLPAVAQPPAVASVDLPTLVLPAVAQPPAVASVEVPTLVGIPALAPTRPTPPAPAPAPPSLETAPKPTRRKRNATGMAVAVAGLVAGVGIGALAVALWRAGFFAGGVSPTPTVEPTTPSTAPASEAPPSAVPAPEESAVIQEAAAAPEPTPSPLEEVAVVPPASASPTPMPSKKPRRRTVRPSPSPPAPPPAPRHAKLAIDFEHPLEEGTLRVWVDDELLLDEELDSQKTKKILVFKGRKGSLAQVLEVLPGEHEIRVEVAWGDNVKTKRISGTFEADATRRLSAKVGGLLKKGLSLRWE